MNILRSLMFIGLLGLSYGIKPEELEQHQETVQINTNEEVTNYIFDVWVADEDMGVCLLPQHEVIKRTKQGDKIYLETYVRNIDINNVRPGDRELIAVFLKMKIEEVQQSCKNNEEWVFVDEKTRCTCIRDRAPIKCVSEFTRQEFKRKKLLNNKKKQ